MSERTTVVVDFPLGRRPTKAEVKGFLVQAVTVEAPKIIGPGRVLGVVGAAFVERRADGQPCLQVKLACEVPEAIQKAAMN